MGRVDPLGSWPDPKIQDQRGYMGRPQMKNGFIGPESTDPVGKMGGLNLKIYMFNLLFKPLAIISMRCNGWKKIFALVDFATNSCV
jgi:hypothetical protein